MIDLQKISGLPIELTDDFKLNFRGIPAVIPSVRKLSDMKAVLADPEAKSDREEMYYMYRDVHLPSDEAQIRENNVRYDITILPPAFIGQEFNKTAGHYHPNIPGMPFAFPEMYEVLSGSALFLIQKMDSNLKNLIAVDGILAQVGDKVIYPPNYAHIIINIGKDALVTANWVADKFKSLYPPIADRQGMAFYVEADLKKGFVMVKNNKYENHPPFRMLTVADKVRTEFGFDKPEPMYTTGVKNIKTLEFLNNPAKYAVELSTITS